MEASDMGILVSKLNLLSRLDKLKVDGLFNGWEEAAVLVLHRKDSKITKFHKDSLDLATSFSLKH